MHWKCRDCKRLVGQVIRVTGQNTKKTRFAWCSVCHRATYQDIATL